MSSQTMDHQVGQRLLHRPFEVTLGWELPMHCALLAPTVAAFVFNTGGVIPGQFVSSSSCGRTANDGLILRSASERTVIVDLSKLPQDAVGVSFLAQPRRHDESSLAELKNASLRIVDPWQRGSDLARYEINQAATPGAPLLFFGSLLREQDGSWQFAADHCPLRH